MKDPWNEGRERTNRLRAIPLEDVLELLGAERDRYDRAKWHTARGALSINDAKFMNWNHGVGGGGAIDLVMHLEDLDFKAALEWLSLRFSSPAPWKKSSLATFLPKKPRTLELPAPDRTMLHLITRYLRNVRQIPSSVLTPLIERNAIYADRRGNVVFVLLGERNQPVGAELRGISSQSWRGMAPGSCKDLGYFSVAPQRADSIVLCESAIDALSLFALRPSSLCVSTAGARPNPRWLSSLLLRNCTIYCGFDADTTGDDIANSMIALHPRVRRLRPPRKDWNDVLKSSP